MGAAVLRFQRTGDGVIAQPDQPALAQPDQPALTAPAPAPPRAARILSEPITVATDAALAALCAAAAWDIARRESASRHDSASQRWACRFWAASLASSALAAASGSVAHGARGWTDHRPATEAWRMSLRAIGLSGAFWTAGAACAASAGSNGAGVTGARTLTLTALVQAAYQAQLGERPTFRPAAAVFGLHLATATALLANSARRGDSAARLGCAAAAVSGAAGAAQIAGWGRTQKFNHNDRFHLIQAVSFGLLHRAALRLVSPSDASLRS